MAHRARALRHGLLLLAATLTSAFAQAPAPTDFTAALIEAEAALAAAVQTPQSRAATPDDAQWHDAITASKQAVAAAEEARRADPQGELATAAWREAQLMLARSYALSNWHSRAFEAYERYMSEAGEPPTEAPVIRGADGTSATLPSDLELLVAALNQLGFARYSAGDLAAARAHYLTVLDLEAAQPEALRWLARIASDEGDYAAAMVAWERLQQVTPADRDVAYFLELATERERYGRAASDAYRLGISSYEAGRLEQALDAFDEAYRLNDEMTDALVWSGRVAQELGQPNRAASYWRAVLSTDPTDQRAAYFLQVAESQLRWGVAAGAAYYQGQAAYSTGDLEEALAAFLSATEANGRFVDAWVWAARSSQELGKPLEAIALWQEVLRLDPSDERARWFLQAAQQELTYGPEAGRAFTAGLEAYRRGDAEAAEAQFELAVEAEPEFAMAWGYLGRISFEAGDYAAAADSYGRALKLEPDNDDYAFFAAEAARLVEPRD